VAGNRYQTADPRASTARALIPRARKPSIPSTSRGRRERALRAQTDRSRASKGQDQRNYHADDTRFRNRVRSGVKYPTGRLRADDLVREAAPERCGPHKIGTGIFHRSVVDCAAFDAPAPTTAQDPRDEQCGSPEPHANGADTARCESAGHGKPRTWALRGSTRSIMAAIAMFGKAASGSRGAALRFCAGSHPCTPNARCRRGHMTPSRSVRILINCIAVPPFLPRPVNSRHVYWPHRGGRHGRIALGWTLSMSAGEPAAVC
jgi:hypothetical protein